MKNTNLNMCFSAQNSIKGGSDIKYLPFYDPQLHYLNKGAMTSRAGAV